MAAALMQRRGVDACVVGADRVVANGTALGMFRCDTCGGSLVIWFPFGDKKGGIKSKKRHHPYAGVRGSFNLSRRQELIGGQVPKGQVEHSQPASH